MKFDRQIYFGYVRDVLFEGALSQMQVDGQNVILGLWENQDTGSPMEDVRWLSYMLATTYHECAQKMWPIREYGLGEGHDYGETDKETGQTYYARGYVGLTWRENYAKASSALGLIDDRDLEWHADLALDSLIAARVMFRGMSEGWFTGKKLGQYFSNTKDDAKNARQIINGNDCDAQIAAYHDQFLYALKDAIIDDVEPLPSLPGTADIDITVTEGVSLTISVNGRTL